jgi:hypothetical protein
VRVALLLQRGIDTNKVMFGVLCHNPIDLDFLIDIRFVGCLENCSTRRIVECNFHCDAKSLIIVIWRYRILNIEYYRSGILYAQFPQGADPWNRIIIIIHYII